MVRLELVEKKAHAAMATCATWAPTNVLYSCSDDQTILKWDQQAEVTGKCCELDAYVTSIAWMPSVGRGVSDVFAVSSERSGNRNNVPSYVPRKSHPKRPLYPAN